MQRVIDIFDEDGNGEVDFKGIQSLNHRSANYFQFIFLTKNLFYSLEFIQGVSQFSVKGDKESKLRFAFRIYDMDNDGYISNGELFQVCTKDKYCLFDIRRMHLIFIKFDGLCPNCILT